MLSVLAKHLRFAAIDARFFGVPQNDNLACHGFLDTLSMTTTDGRDGTGKGAPP
jgi:hypothetical protein